LGHWVIGSIGHRGFKKLKCFVIRRISRRGRRGAEFAEGDRKAVFFEKIKKLNLILHIESENTLCALCTSAPSA